MNVLLKVGQRAKKIIFFIFFWRAWMCWPPFVYEYVSHFVVFERYLDSNLESFRSPSEATLCAATFSNSYVLWLNVAWCYVLSQYHLATHRARIINLLCVRVRFVYLQESLLQICLPAFLSCWRFVFHSFSAAAHLSSVLSKLLQLRLASFLYLNCRPSHCLFCTVSEWVQLTGGFMG